MLDILGTVIKENPWKMFFGSASSIIAIVGALFALDARYAHAADVQRDKAETQRFIEENTMSIRRQMLEDKIFELDLKKSQNKNQQLSPIDQALRDRYQRQLDDLNQRHRQLNNQ
jgi:hypothetical protein